MMDDGDRSSDSAGGGGLVLRDGHRVRLRRAWRPGKSRASSSSNGPCRPWRPRGTSAGPSAGTADPASVWSCTMSTSCIACVGAGGHAGVSCLRRIHAAHGDDSRSRSRNPRNGAGAIARGGEDDVVPCLREPYAQVCGSPIPDPAVGLVGARGIHGGATIPIRIVPPTSACLPAGVTVDPNEVRQGFLRPQMQLNRRRQPRHVCVVSRNLDGQPGTGQRHLLFPQVAESVREGRAQPEPAG